LGVNFSISFSRDFSRDTLGGLCREDMEDENAKFKKIFLKKKGRAPYGAGLKII
jgi:hypothetical protein